MKEYINMQQLIQEQNNELNRILDFWMTKVIDTEKGGFLGCINDFGMVIEGSPKGAVQNSRILWTFSSAFNFSRNPLYLETADRAFDYIKNHFIDKEHGGVIWEVSFDGKPKNTRKQAYALGFAVYALSEYYAATKNEESLSLAIDIFRLLEQKFRDRKQGGYIEALQKDWSELDDFRLSEKDANYPKSMNTHLHILEPYTNLYRVWPNAELKEAIIHLIEIFTKKIISHKTDHFQLFFDMEWNVKSNIDSYGHDIEGAWLLREAAIEIGDEKILKEVEELSLKLVNVTLKEGLDKDGSLFNEKDGDHLDSDKHWWPQAEAMVGLLDAYEIEANPSYLEHVNKVWEFIKAHIIDKENGEWFWRVDKDNKVIRGDDKAGFWKCPYHNSRALIEVINRLNKLEKDRL